MTFILGSRCKDGVVIVADRKITSINEIDSITFEYKEKIFAILRHVIFASSGSTHTFELFRDYLIDQVKSRQDITFDNAILKLTDIVLDINKKRDFQRKLYFELLVALQYDDKPSTLTWISGEGTNHLVERYYTLGIGGILVNHFLDTAWYPEINMEDAAVLAWFLIKYIEDFKLHSSVGVNGGYPQIHFIPDNERNEDGQKVDYEINPQTKPELFTKIRKDVIHRFNKQKKSMKW